MNDQEIDKETLKQYCKLDTNLTEMMRFHFLNTIKRMSLTDLLSKLNIKSAPKPMRSFFFPDIDLISIENLDGKR